MAKKKQKQKLTQEQKEGYLDSLLFQSYFETKEGVVCSCSIGQLTHFHGMLPNKLCGKVLEDVDISTVPEFESNISSLCPCQQSHFYRMKVKNSEMTMEAIEGKDMDERKLRLPNF
jgi:hypothetical protein